MKKIILFISALLVSVSLCACSSPADKADIWADAVYTEDTELGEGSKTFTLEVTAEGKSVAFTVNTDKQTVGEALEDCKLISGEQGPYGLYVKVVNGIEADYTKSKSYWSFTIDGSAAQTGVDSENIEEGTLYGFEYTK